ncbi:MAG: DUF3253 domain-containing protein [Acidobacteriota bacterium]
MTSGDHPTCASCGRRMEPRRRWARQPQPTRYCSPACRRRRVNRIDHALEGAILELLEGRARHATICPSEAARAVAPETWRELMEPARRAARRLVAVGRLEILQGGRVVDPSTARGPIRLRRALRSEGT